MNPLSAPALSLPAPPQEASRLRSALTAASSALAAPSDPDFLQVGASGRAAVLAQEAEALRTQLGQLQVRGDPRTKNVTPLRQSQ